MLLALLLVPLITGILCACLPGSFSKGISYVGLVLNSILLLVLGQQLIGINSPLWLLQQKLPWIPSWSVSFNLGIDGFAYWLILLTQVLGLCAVFISFPKQRMRSYFASLNWAIFGVVGLFLSADTLLFFIFWEVALLPIYWILVTSEGALKLSQALRFIVLTQVSGLFLLLAILGLSFFHFEQSGIFTFEYASLIKNSLAPSAQYWLLLLFLAAFLIKLPAVPFHGWMPSLFSHGPASTILVAILVKTSIFGLVRFSWPLLPLASAEIAVPVMWLGVATLLYGALLAFSQNEPKRIMAYATLSHAGLLLMGVFSEQGFYGVLLLTASSALSTAAILIIFERRSATNLSTLSGLWHSHPKLSVVLLTMLLASMGFPIFGNFVGEWLILWSIFSNNVALAILASLGIILSAAYGLRLFQRLCLGQTLKAEFSDLKTAEMGVLLVLTMLIISLGLAPALVLDQFNLKTSLTSLTDTPEELP